CEARWHGETLAWVVIGLGLNVRNEPPAGTRLPAAALAEWRPDLEPAALAVPVAAAIQRLRGAGTLTAEELAAWRSRDWLLGRQLAAPVQGVVHGLTPLGELVVETATGKRLLAAGDASSAELA
ncbi:MAG TPA: hypothetical protein VFX50_05575, partial [Gemmatimonadales bacterium]|nr:hypothetical protein [Gemmatimonadales bacterium]